LRSAQVEPDGNRHDDRQYQSATPAELTLMTQLEVKFTKR